MSQYNPITRLRIARIVMGDLMNNLLMETYIHQANPLARNLLTAYREHNIAPAVEDRKQAFMDALNAYLEAKGRADANVNQ